MNAHGLRSGFFVVSVGVTGGADGCDVGTARGLKYGDGIVGPMRDAPGTSTPVSPGRPWVVSAAMVPFPWIDRR
jgi:hypothetical protein